MNCMKLSLINLIYSLLTTLFSLSLFLSLLLSKCHKNKFRMQYYIYNIHLMILMMKVKYNCIYYYYY